MPIKVTIPKLGLTMEEGKILNWKKKEGERVEKGEILFVLETEKVIFEVEAQNSGIVGKIVAKEGDVLPVGGLVAYMLTEGEKITDIQEEIIEKKEGDKESKLATPDAPVAEPAPADREIKISPVARKMAKELDIDIASIKGTGPEGRIIREDVQRAAEEKKMSIVQGAAEKQATPGEKLVPLSPLRKAVSKRMTQSFKTPHFYMTIEVDAQELMRVREQLIPHVEKRVGIKLTHTDLLIKIVAKVLEDNPSLNCSFADGAVRLFDRIHIGVATAVEGGLIVPVIRDANKKTVEEICVLRAQIIQKTRDRKITPEEITGSTFTITNVGMWGVDFSNPIINPPEAAILAVGAIKDKPVARNGNVEIRAMMNFTLAIDHRVLDGSDAAAFLNHLKKYVENPAALLL